VVELLEQFLHLEPFRQFAMLLAEQKALMIQSLTQLATLQEGQ
jgi:hypothetical protein